MAEAESKRQRRTPQERANELDEKITKINQSINELEEKKKTGNYLADRQSNQAPASEKVLSKKMENN